MTVVKIAAVFLVIATAAFFIGLKSGKPKGRVFDRTGLADRKATVVEHQIAQIEGDYALVVGDSIVERAYLGELCGLPVVTAGVSGSSLAELQPLTHCLASLRPAKIVVLAAGINSFRVTGAKDMVQWEASLVANLESLGVVSGIVALIESDEVDREAVREANSIIDRVASERGITLVPAISAEMTLDGVHPSASGYQAWKENLQRFCKTI